MISRFVKYDQSGRILYIGEVPTSMLELQEQAGTHILVGDADPASDYVLDGAVTARPLQATSLADNALTALPQPCTIYINGTAYPCTDARAELDFTYPGTYAIRVEAFPYLDAEFNVMKK